MVKPPPLKSPWAAAAASVIFTLCTTYGFHLYSYLHWTVLFHHFSEFTEPSRKELFVLLWLLERYRIGAVFAVAFGIWAVCSRPRWPGIVALALSLLAILEALTLQ
jgi:hypothetical protein